MKGSACFDNQRCRSCMREALSKWFRANARDLPWRRSYAWGRYVSEIMLQQTQAATVVPYFETFMEQFPTPESLAQAGEDEVLKAWEGLGFYRRARHLHSAAQVMVDFHEGNVPYEYSALRKLPGVGDYTAGALASFLANARTPAIDGNVWRVMLRILALNLKQGKAADKKLIENKLKQLLEHEQEDVEVDAALINEALIELGARICRPKSQALCKLCPWQDFCQAKEQDIVAQLPQPKASPIRPVTTWTVPILETPQGFLIHERPEKGLLAGLYEFPMVDSKEYSRDMLAQGLDGRIDHRPIAQIKHLFSHREWNMSFYRGRLESSDVASLARLFGVDSARLLFVERKDLSSLPMPAYLNELRSQLNG